MGRLYAPNLTPGGNIDDWSDGELVRAIREGVHKTGRSLIIMTSGTFSHLSDDVRAIVAYLRAQPPTGKPMPSNRFNVGAMFVNLIDLRSAGPPIREVTAPPAGTVAYGKYMVDIIGCSDCHGVSYRASQKQANPARPLAPTSPELSPTGHRNNS